jgi:2,5-diketo-D-gluconate reductase B
LDRITTQGMSMPKLGLGTWRMKGAECAEAVQRALGLGYRHIDTAEMYGNEEAVGEALANAGVPRDQVHVTSKVWYENLSADAMQRSIDASLAKLRTDYLDLYLIHWPSPDMDLPNAVHNLMRVKEQGKARAIGVSNFPVALLRRAVEEVQAPIACNQFEYHVLLGQSSLVGYCQSHDVAASAYAPLAQGRLAEHEELQAIARKHGVTPAQVALKWLLDQPGVAAIPKAMRAESQQANLDALKIELDDTDRAAISMLPKTQRFVNPGWAPVWDLAA